jgi:hypothetical protein
MMTPYERWLAQRWVLICTGGLWALVSPCFAVIGIDRGEPLVGWMVIAAVFEAWGIGCVWWGIRTLRRGYQGDRSTPAFPKKWVAN